MLFINSQNRTKKLDKYVFGILAIWRRTHHIINHLNNIIGIYFIHFSGPPIIFIKGTKMELIDSIFTNA